MLGNILDLVKNTVSGTVTNNTEIPENKKTETIQTTANAVTDGLKQNLSMGNIGNLMSLFKGNTAPQGNPVTNSIQSTVSNELINKVGLSSGIATTIAATVVPMVMKAITSKLHDPNDKSFNLENLVNSLGGGNATAEVGSSDNGVLGGLGKIFGR